MGKQLIRKGRKQGSNVSKCGHVLSRYQKHARSELVCG